MTANKDTTALNVAAFDDWRADTKGDVKAFVQHYALSEALADVHFLVGTDDNNNSLEKKKKKERFPAHTFVLSMRSPVFETMFSDDWKSTLANNENNTIEVPDIVPNAFRLMLLHCYGHRFEFRKWEDSILSLYYAATKYMLPELKRLCYNALLATVSPKTAPLLLQFAHGAFDELEEVALHTFKRHFKESVDSEHFPQLTKATLKTLFTAVQTTKAIGDKDLCEAAIRWATAQSTSSVSSLPLSQGVENTSSSSSSTSQLSSTQATASVWGGGGGGHLREMLGEELIALIRLPPIPEVHIKAIHEYFQLASALQLDLPPELIADRRLQQLCAALSTTSSATTDDTRVNELRHSSAIPMEKSGDNAKGNGVHFRIFKVEDVQKEVRALPASCCYEVIAHEEMFITAAIGTEEKDENKEEFRFKLALVYHGRDQLSFQVQRPREQPQYPGWFQLRIRTRFPDYLKHKVWTFRAQSVLSPVQTRVFGTNELFAPENGYLTESGALEIEVRCFDNEQAKPELSDSDAEESLPRENAQKGDEIFSFT